VVCRATNRVIVGQPLCREEEYLDMQLHFAANVSKARMVINLFPKVLKGYVHVLGVFSLILTAV
jgi:hypothetical protein